MPQISLNQVENTHNLSSKSAKVSKLLYYVEKNKLNRKHIRSVHCTSLLPILVAVIAGRGHPLIFLLLTVGIDHQLKKVDVPPLTQIVQAGSTHVCQAGSTHVGQAGSIHVGQTGSTHVGQAGSAHAGQTGSTHVGHSESTLIRRDLSTHRTLFLPLLHRLVDDGDEERRARLRYRGDAKQPQQRQEPGRENWNNATTSFSFSIGTD